VSAGRCETVKSTELDVKCSPSAKLMSMNGYVRRSMGPDRHAHRSFSHMARYTTKRRE